MADSSDRRAAERMAVNSQANCTFAGRIAEDIGPARVRDVSMTGVGVILTRRVEVGSLITISIAAAANAATKFSKTMLVKVAHVTTVPGGFLIGGTFVEPLTYQIPLPLTA